MAIDLNKGGGEEPKSRINLSKSEGATPTSETKSGSISEDKASKTKSSRILLFSIIGLICLGAVYFLVANQKTEEPKKIVADQVTANNAAKPADNISPVNDGNSKVGNAVANNLPNQQGLSKETTKEVPDNSSNLHKATPTTKNNSNNNPATTKSSLPGNSNIPYKANETYPVYQFPFGASDYSAANPELDKLADVLKKNSVLNISISAYTDDVGGEAINRNLSVKRAKSIRDYLINKGIDAGRIKYEGKGISTKFAIKAENRRAEFVLID